MNQLGIVASTQSNRTSVHTLKFISAWMLDGNRIDNPFYVRLKDRQEKGANDYAQSDDMVTVLPMTPQEDSDSHMEGNLPNSNECRQTEVMNETYVSDAVFSFVGKMPIILDEGELLSPFLLFLPIRLLHSLRQGKNLMRIFRQIVRFSHIGYGDDAYIFVWGLARSSYVAQICFAYSYHIGVFRQSQAPTVLSLFRLMSHP